MEYITEEGKKFKFSYSELQGNYNEFIQMSDKEFMDNLPEATHFAAYVCFIKEIPTYVCLSDTGIVHEMIHLLSSGTTTGLTEIRELFNKQLELK